MFSQWHLNHLISPWYFPKIQNSLISRYSNLLQAGQDQGTCRFGQDLVCLVGWTNGLALHSQNSLSWSLSCHGMNSFAYFGRNNGRSSWCLFGLFPIDTLFVLRINFETFDEKNCLIRCLNMSCFLRSSWQKTLSTLSESAHLWAWWLRLAIQSGVHSIDLQVSFR